MLANFQFQVHVQLAAGKVLLVVDLCVGSPTSLAQYAHTHFHPSTTLLPSRDFPIQALLFPNFTSISFFIPPINTVFYLIERIIQYFILLNDCDKEQKRRACVEATRSTAVVVRLIVIKAKTRPGIEAIQCSEGKRNRPGLTGCHGMIGHNNTPTLLCVYMEE